MSGGDAQGASNGRNQNARRCKDRSDRQAAGALPEDIRPSGLEFGWPVHKGSIGYKVAEEIVALAEPAANGSTAPAKGSKRAKR
jgi:hypothetical protein